MSRFPPADLILLKYIHVIVSVLNNMEIINISANMNTLNPNVAIFLLKAIAACDYPARNRTIPKESHAECLKRSLSFSLNSICREMLGMLIPSPRSWNHESQE